MMVEHHHENFTPVLASYLFLHGIWRRDFLLPQAVGPGVLGMKVFALFIVIAMSVSMMAHYLFQIHHFAPGERFPGGIIDVYRRAGGGNCLCAVYSVDDHYRADKFHYSG